MDENSQNDNDAAAGIMVKKNSQSFDPFGGHDDKKSAFWMGGVLNCFSSVFSLLGGPDLKPTEEDDWEVPFDSITDLVYLGAGAQGVVFSGNLNGELVAVKKLRDKSELNIKHLRKLNHENIVRFRGVCTEAPYYCIIMEYCQYGPLFDFLHSGACFSPRQILKWAKDIAYGMAYIHSHKYIHRDLKSPNILISDNLTVKVSDFGTTREWNNVSTVMSFTGTVAWMAPEVIRHEPCSERVDVWSYGVVLWELLTQEIPFKNMETHAIMWGVGTDTISLPIPSTLPESLKLLLQQCWNRVPRNRPPFKIIAAHLDIAARDLCALEAECFSITQAAWRNEVQEGMNKLFTRSPSQPLLSLEDASRREEIKQARDVRQVYEKQLLRANELYMEVCAIRLQLEQREKAITEREKALKTCRCGVRKNFKYYQHQSSSSSEGHKVPHCIKDTENAQRKKLPVSQAMARLFENERNNVIVTTIFSDNDDDEGNSDTNVDNRNVNANIKETVVETNGNIKVGETCVQLYKASGLINDNYIPNVTQV